MVMGYYSVVGFAIIKQNPELLLLLKFVILATGIIFFANYVNCIVSMFDYRLSV